MASPFRIFRKYQKTFLAIAAVLAMVIFVFADLFTSAIGPSGGDSTKGVQVTSWDGGSLKSDELSFLAQRRINVGQTIAKVYWLGRSRLTEEGENPPEPPVRNFGLPLQISNDLYQAIRTQCVSTKIFSQLAREAGIAVSDQQVISYLKTIGFDEVTNQEIAGFLQGNRAQAETRLFKCIRDLLLEDMYVSSFRSSASSVTPEQRWQDWKRVNQRISIEAAVLPTSRFISKVPEPSEAEILALYEDYKDIDSDARHRIDGRTLPAPTAGFRESRKVECQLLIADIEKRSLELMESVTEEEIADYYERNKRSMFVEIGASASAGSNSTEETGTSDASDESAETNSEDSGAKGDYSFLDEDTPNISAESTESSAETVEDSGDESDSSSEEIASTEETEPSSDETEDSSVEEAAVEPESGDQTGETSTEVSEETSDSEAPKEVQEDSSNSSSQTTRRSPFRLVTLQEEEDAEDSESDTTDEPAAEAEDEQDDSEEGSDTSVATESEVEEAIKYKPLDDVRYYIRSELAKDKAVVELEKDVKRAMSRLEKSYRDNIEVFAQAKEEKSTPPTPDYIKGLSKLAEELNLVHQTPQALTSRQMADTSWGTALDEQNQELSVVRACFSNLTLFEPFLARDRYTGNWYLVIKVKDQPKKTPKLEDIRDTVIEAWKKREAAQLALKQAQEYAKEVKESGESLELFFASKPYDTETTDLFSWLTFGAAPPTTSIRAPQLGDAPPLQSVGNAFMSEAFSLKEGEFSAALNHDETSAYVIHLASQEQSEEELRKQFLEDANVTPSGVSLLLVREQGSNQQVLSNILDQVNLDKEALQSYMTKESE